MGLGSSETFVTQLQQSSSSFVAVQGISQPQETVTSTPLGSTASPNTDSTPSSSSGNSVVIVGIIGAACICTLILVFVRKRMSRSRVLARKPAVAMNARPPVRRNTLVLEDVRSMP